MNDSRQSRRHFAVFALLMLLVMALPLMMGNRTPLTLTTSGLVLVFGALLVALASFGGARFEARLASPRTGWWIFAAVLSFWVLLQVLPFEPLARALGPYPEALWRGESKPGQWSPNPAYTLRAWATFVALLTIAWTAANLRKRYRNMLWLVIACSALFQSLYGLSAHAAGSETIFGIWQRKNVEFVHGSFSNRNLFAGYLALTLPLVISVWWRNSMPFLSKLPSELRVAGSIISGAIVGVALLGSASRLGSAAGLAGMLLGLVLWMQYRARINRFAIWPMLTIAVGILVTATWYGLTPLTERLVMTSIDSEPRLEVFSKMLTETEPVWWLTGVGLGGFEAVFKQVQPGDLGGWYDYAHNDLLQWLFEMGVVGAGLLAAAAVAVWRNARLTPEVIPLYAGLAALGLIALGDFSWHIPATQVVLALYLGTVLTSSISTKTKKGDEPHKKVLNLRSA